MTADLSALIARLEAAEAGSRELDGAVWYAIYEPDVDHGCLHVERAEQGPIEVLTCELGSKHADCVGDYTTSLDAALALAESVLGTDQEYEITTLYNIARVTLNMNHGDESGPLYGSNDCCVVPLAICAATLRAKLDGYAAEGEVNKNPKAQEG